MIRLVATQFFFQFIPQISSLNPYTTLIPIVIVLAITAIKDGVDDFVSICTFYLGVALWYHVVLVFKKKKRINILLCVLYKRLLFFRNAIKVIGLSMEEKSAC